MFFMGLTWFKYLFSGSIAELKAPPKSQIPFLDGLRTIAILLELNGHVAAHIARSYGSNFYSHLLFVRNGWVGVDLFLCATIILSAMIALLTYCVMEWPFLRLRPASSKNDSPPIASLS
jgi:peptidoglycan/LPS O-acetylase OafA/YrhL